MNKAFLILILLTSAVASAEVTEHVSAQPDAVRSAAIKAIEARAVPSLIGDDHVSFACKKSYGSVRFARDGGGSKVTVEVFGHDEKEERAIMQGIVDALSGKEPREDATARAKAQKAVEKWNRAEARAQASLAVSPASARVHGSVEAVKSALVSECAARGFAITSETEHQITVSRIVSASQDAGWMLSKILVGNYTAEAFRANAQFTLALDGNEVIASTVSEVLVQNGYGAVTRVDVSNNREAVTALQQILDSVKTKVENAAPRSGQVPPQDRVPPSR
jgi:hypothetical protein